MLRILILFTLFFTSTQTNADDLKLPDGYTPFQLTFIENKDELKVMEEIWSENIKDVLPDDKGKFDFYSYKVDRGNNKYDIISMMYSPMTCGIQNCPLKIVTKEMGKYKTLLDVYAPLAIGYDFMALSPIDDGKNRNILFMLPQGISVWSYDEKTKTYIREEK